jgi:hypothetical protein
VSDSLHFSGAIGKVKPGNLLYPLSRPNGHPLHEPPPKKRNLLSPSLSSTSVWRRGRWKMEGCGRRDADRGDRDGRAPQAMKFVALGFVAGSPASGVRARVLAPEKRERGHRGGARYPPGGGNGGSIWFNLVQSGSGFGGSRLSGRRRGRTRHRRQGLGECSAFSLALPPMGDTYMTPTTTEWIPRFDMNQCMISGKWQHPLHP